MTEWIQPFVEEIKDLLPYNEDEAREMILRKIKESTFCKRIKTFLVSILSSEMWLEIFDLISKRKNSQTFLIDIVKLWLNECEAEILPTEIKFLSELLLGCFSVKGVNHRVGIYRLLDNKYSLGEKELRELVSRFAPRNGSLFNQIISLEGWNGFSNRLLKNLSMRDTEIVAILRAGCSLNWKQRKIVSEIITIFD